MWGGCDISKIVERVDNWFMNKYDEPLGLNQAYPFYLFVLYTVWFLPRNFIGKWYWRIFVRGMCAIKGCDEHYSCGGYLPDDACEWYCKRCGAEGINFVVYTRDFFSRSDGRLRNFVRALRGG